MTERIDFDLLRAAHEGEAATPASRKRVVVRLVLLSLPFAALAALAGGTGYRFTPAGAFDPPTVKAIPTDGKELAKLDRTLSRDQRKLLGELQRTEPRGNYLVIDSTQNRIYLMKDGEVVHAAVCSAGSGVVLTDSSRGKKWVFDTPRGVFKVRNRIENPVWRKPDWAFIEEGKPIPRDASERFETGTLGEYAMYLEDGYMIHGTLYERLLGRSVSHGCVRVGRDDLRVLWKNTQLGTPVYIF